MGWGEKWLSDQTACECWGISQGLGGIPEVALRPLFTPRPVPWMGTGASNTGTSAQPSLTGSRRLAEPLREAGRPVPGATVCNRRLVWDAVSGLMEQDVTSLSWAETGAPLYPLSFQPMRSKAPQSRMKPALQCLCPIKAERLTVWSRLCPGLQPSCPVAPKLSLHHPSPSSPLWLRASSRRHPEHQHQPCPPFLSYLPKKDPYCVCPLLI